MPAQISSSTPKGQIAGQQAFGPYGEEIINATVPSGYKPLTGYTGHLNEDMTGLIYMKGRYYSPLWHRFINSDQGVDPNSINQFAYVGGRPFMAKDPSGMRSCVTFTMAVPDLSYDDSYSNGTVVLAYKLIDIEICYGGRSGGAADMPGGGVGGGGGGGGGGGSDKFAQMQKRAQKEQQENKTHCERYAEALAQSASSYKEQYPRTGSYQFGKDLYDRAIDDIKLSSFGQHKGYTGFKDIFVNNGQGNGVYRHVSASIGVSVQAGLVGMFFAASRGYYDLYNYFRGNPEGLPESHGDAAGIILAPSFNQFFDGYHTPTSLKESIMRVLCNH